MIDHPGPVVQTDLPLRFEGDRQIGTATVTHTPEGMDLRFTLFDNADIVLTERHAFHVREGFVDLERLVDTEVAR